MPLTTNRAQTAQRITTVFITRDISRLSSLISCAAAGVLISVWPATSASAQNLVKNGQFTSFLAAGTPITTPGTTNTVNSTGGNGQLGYNTNVDNWSVSTTNVTYNFVFASGTISNSTATTGQSGALFMAGTGDPKSDQNGLTGIAPGGGNILAADSVYETGAISQQITGLTVGKTYYVQFTWGGAQQYSYSGATTDQWDVTFGGTTQNTNVLNNVSQGFTGWETTTFSYTATATSQALSFLAAGGPTGSPPFSLLSNVVVTASGTPEPATLGLMLTGVVTGIMLVRKRKR